MLDLSDMQQRRLQIREDLENRKSEKIPILLIAYCRPQTLAAQLERIEKLSRRNIWISIDGHSNAPNSTKKGQEEVVAISKNFFRNSKHSVNLSIREANLGLLLHFKKTLGEFFFANDVGIVLEDDIVFTPEFVSVVENLWKRGQLEKYWSVCGHNPISSSEATSLTSPIKLFQTYVHTIWGWASTAENVRFFLDYLESPNQESIGQGAITKVSKGIASDPLLRWLFRRTWNFKLQRALNSSRPNWDNFWELAAWQSNKKSLMFTHSQSVESNQFGEAQTHEGSRKTPSLSFCIFTESKHVAIDRQRRKRDTKLLSVWGVSHSQLLKLLTVMVSQQFKDLFSS